MSYLAVLTCPHCGAQKMTFDVSESPFLCADGTKFFCQCRSCHDVVVVTGEGNDHYGSTTEIEVHSVFPCPSEPSPPPDTPEDVAKPFIEGLTALDVGLINSAGNSFRTALEKATSHLLDGFDASAEDPTRMQLFHRIESLRDNHLITPSLYEWAHLIRDLGNRGTHGDAEFTRGQAVELKNFTEQFLFYVFTMPARVKHIRGDPNES